MYLNYLEDELKKFKDCSGHAFLHLSETAIFVLKESNPVWIMLEKYQSYFSMIVFKASHLSFLDAELNTQYNF